MTAMTSELAALTTHMQALDQLAKGGFLKGIGTVLLVGVLVLVLLGVFIGMKMGRRR